jgi:zinc transport system permease protein
VDILEFLSYGFIQRALVSGVFISVLCSTLGVLLVLRRLSLIGDGLAHVTFGSVAIGLVFRVYPIYISIPLVMMSSVGILKLTEKAGLFGDAAIGIVSSIGIATGIVLASAAGGFNVDLFSYLFGNILSISEGEVIISVVLSVIVLLIVSSFYHDILSITFDEEFARASGINVNRINILVVLMTSVTVVLTMNVVGIMLISALLILPAVTALQISRSFKNTMIIASLSALASVIAGTFMSFVMNIPSGATIVLTNFAFFVAAFLYKTAVMKMRPSSNHSRS